MLFSHIFRFVLSVLTLRLASLLPSNHLSSPFSSFLPSNLIRSPFSSLDSFLPLPFSPFPSLRSPSSYLLSSLIFPHPFFLYSSFPFSSSSLTRLQLFLPTSHSLSPLCLSLPPSSLPLSSSLPSFPLPARKRSQTRG